MRRGHGVLDDVGHQDEEAVARAIVNILEDTAGERDQLELTHKALLNILDDFAVATEDLRNANHELTYLDELKSEFVAMVSHELRTPLTSITGFASTMLDNWEGTSEQAKFQYVGIIDEQSRRLFRLVESLLTVSRIESGMLASHARRFAVGDAIRLAIQGIDAHDIDVVCDDELTVVADSDHFQQVVVNYLSNAIKHGAEPFCVEASSGDGYVTIRVVDHGDGVSAEFVPHLFERFTQADADQSRSAVGGQGKGTGLGLSIVQALMRAHGGSASYEAVAPHGSCFVARFPEVAPS